MRGTEPDDTESPEPVQLVDVHRLLTGENAISVNQAILRDMVWSFFRAVTHALLPEAYPLYVRFLDPALAAVSTSEQNPNRILDHYWMKRLLTPLSHVDAMAEVWKDVQSVPTPVGPSVMYAETGFYNPGHHTSMPWWLTFLQVLGFGFGVWVLYQTKWIELINWRIVQK